jgi:YD repeat-containing protein
MITHNSANPTNSANLVGGSVDNTGYQSLPRNGMVRETVRLHSGELSREITLVSVPSVIADFDFTISNFMHDESVGSLGHKWRHKFEARIVTGASLVTVITGDGALFDYISDGLGGWALDTSTTRFQTHELSNPTGTIWELKSVPKGRILRFDDTALPGYPATAGRLTEIEDRHGNVMTLHYASGKLTSIEEPQGRQIVLGYTGGLVTTVTDPRSEVHLLTYDAFENLTNVSGPEGCTVTFEYAQQDNHQITAITDARGNTTRYTFKSDRIEAIIYPDDRILSYSYLLGDEGPEEWLGDSGHVHFDTTLVTVPDGSIFEYRFDPAANLWRSIFPSGHIKRFFWNNQQRFLYASEGYQLQYHYTMTLHGPADNMHNKFTRHTVNERGDNICTVDSTGIGDTFTYDSEGRLLSKHPGQVNQGVQGAWEGHYGEDGIILCAFNADDSDIYRAPSYLNSSISTAITNGDGVGGHLFARDNFDTPKVIDPRAPVLGDGSIKSAVGHWKQSGSAAPGADFQFSINLTSSQAFNLSLYSHSADHGISANSPMKYCEQFGRDVEVEVEDIHGVQSYRIMNNSTGVWATFPVEGDASNPINITVRATGSNTMPVISAIAFDPFQDRRTFYEYTSGDLTRITDGLGNETDYVYNADGTLLSVTDARGLTTTYSYLDADKNLTKVADADSNDTLLEYDENGNVTKVTDANLNETVMTYDGKNRLLTTTDALSNVTTIDYDGNGNVLSIVDAKSRETLFTYDSLNQVIAVENELGHITRMSYDANGRLETQTNPRGFVTRYSYNSDGNLSTVEGPDGEQTSMSYDFLNRMVALTGPNGNQETMELVNLVGARNFFKNHGFENVNPHIASAPTHWNPSGGSASRDTAESNGGDASIPLSLSEYSWSQTRLHLPEGAKFVARAHAKRDSQELILKAELRNFAAEIETVQSTESFGDKFDDWAPSEALAFTVPGDAQTTFTNPTMVSFSAQVAIANNKVGWLDDMELFMLSQAYRYDTKGRLKSVTTPDGAKITLHRDRLGRVVASEDPRGYRTAMAYDVIDRVVSLTKPSGETLWFEYNEVGALVSFKDGLAQETLFAYDSLNRLETITYPDTTTEEFSYDGVGNLLSYTDNAAQVRSFAYDSLNRLETITYPDTTTLDMVYDEVGNLTSLTERNGDLLEYDYDDIDRLVTVTRTKDTGNSTPEWEFHYTFDENGNRLSVSDGVGELWSVNAAQSAYGTARYGAARYTGGLDAMDRPRGISKGATLHAQFRYDSEGRRNGVDFNNGASTDVSFDIVGKPLSLSTVNEDGSLLSVAYRYDEAANRIGHVTGSDTFDYNVDEDGKLVRESVNRLVLNGSMDFAKGFLDAVRLDDTLQLLPLDDDLLSTELDCDRWRVVFDINGDPFTTLIVGAEIRQKDGLHMRFPRGYSNRVKFRDNVQPLNDPYGTSDEYLYQALEHRTQLTGDFDVRVDVTDFQGEASPGVLAGLRLSQSPLESSAYYHLRLDVTSAGQLALSGAGGVGPTSTMTAPALPTTLRLVRSGATITAYAWDSGTSTWLTQADWIKTLYSVPLWVSINTYTPAANSGTATYKNFLFNQTVAPSRATSGTFTSAVYDAGRNVGWSNISWAETLPASTNIELQVAFADDPKGPWTYIGPDGTPATKFTTPGGQSVGASKISRYARIKAYLTGDGAATPTLGSIELSYGGTLTSQHQSYGFDAAGNVTEVVTKTDSTLVAETRTYDDLNQIIDNEIDDGSPVTWDYTHDTNGNLTSKTDGTDTWDYAWDEDGRLLGVELNSSPVVTYEYDSASRLIQRVEGGTTTNLHWHDWDLIKEVKTGSISETTNYLVPFGEVLAFERGGDWFYLHSDGLSSTQLITDENGDQVGRFINAAWGEELYASETIPGLFENRFVGGLGCRKDAATGLIYMRHRWYDAYQLPPVFISSDEMENHVKVKFRFFLKVYNQRNELYFQRWVPYVPEPNRQRLFEWQCG